MLSVCVLALMMLAMMLIGHASCACQHPALSGLVASMLFAARIMAALLPFCGEAFVQIAAHR